MGKKNRDDDVPELQMIVDEELYFDDLEVAIQMAIRDAHAMASLRRGDTVLGKLADALRSNGLPIAKSHVATHPEKGFIYAQRITLIFEVDRHGEAQKSSGAPPVFASDDTKRRKSAADDARGALGYEVICKRARMSLEKALSARLAGDATIRVFFPPYGVNALLQVTDD